MRRTLEVVGWSLIAACTMPLLPGRSWWLRGWDFPRFQVTALTAAVALAWLRARRRDSLHDTVLLTALVGSIAHQALAMAPYTPLAPLQARDADPAEEPEVAVLVANVLMHNRQYDRLATLVEREDPDVVLLLEPDAAWRNAMEPLRQRYPHRVEHPLDNTYGMLLYARYPLEDTSVSDRIEAGVPSVTTIMRLPDDRRVALHCVHPSPPAPSENPRSTERDAELLTLARELDDPEMPTIVCGDLNDVAWSHTTRVFLRVAGMLDPRVGRGVFPTYPVRWPLLRWPLDHLFHSRHFAVRDLRRLDDIGSDHFPILVRLVLDGNQQVPRPTEGDHAAVDSAQRDLNKSP